MSCSLCGRNVALGGVLERFKKLSSKQRAASLAATARWLKKFKEIHKTLVEKEKKL